MKILLSNDDGVHAKGIEVLYNTLKEIADVTVVAPSEERSATGQTLTLEHPIRLEEVKKDFYSVSGYPADCVIMGLLHVLDEKPDVVVSGINRGANLGQDIYYSGTVAAARQAVFNNVPGIAVSTVIDYQSYDYNDIHYQSAADYIKKILKNGIHEHLPPMHLLNINVPDLKSSEIKGHKVTELGTRFYSEEVERRVDQKGKEYFWLGGQFEGHCSSVGSDCNAVDNAKISTTLLNLLGHSTDKIYEWDKLL